MCDYQFLSSNHSLPKGKFYSPRYPSSYPSNVRCTYRFIGRVKERIRIFFEEVTLQKGDVSCLNRGDVIKVHEGKNGLSPVIRVICNEAVSIEVLSTGHHLYIEFLSSSDWPGQGFKATFEFQQNLQMPSKEINVEGTELLPPAVGASGPSCDVRINSESGESGVVTSPGYPSPYPPGTRCRYHFQGRGKQRVQVKITDLNLEPTENQQDCNAVDSLTAYVMADGRLDKIETFCGQEPTKVIMSNGARLVLELKGLHSSKTARGFRAEYTFTENFGITTGRQLSEYPCAFRYTSDESPNGYITSPNFPGLYPRDTECHYFFHGANWQRILLQFQYFDLEGVPPCNSSSASDYLEFSNFLAQDRKYGRHCGQQPGLTVESERKYFRVTFRSNDKLDATGFNATYSFITDAHSFPTHARPSHISNSFSCLIAPDSWLLLIHLTSFIFIY